MLPQLIAGLQVLQPKLEGTIFLRHVQVHAPRGCPGESENFCLRLTLVRLSINSADRNTSAQLADSLNAESVRLPCYGVVKVLTGLSTRSVVPSAPIESTL